MSGINYRPDVDGLRAVAVLLVLLFHSRIGFPGGYVGVDVFFVISGYLITGLILKQQRAGTFRLRDFWHRRIRRIVPASAVMVFATLAAGFVLFPSDYVELAESALAQQLMLSNVYFWQRTGYFAGPADLKPLLHTWSLAVEEQFYVLYPFLLLLLARFTPRHVSRVLLAATLASFVLSEWGVRNYPSATFFLLPTRAWELLLGGLLCFTRPPADSWRWLSQLVGVAGLCAVVVSASCFDETTQFPGKTALLPCVGAALCIYSNSGAPNLAGRLLALRPVVFVGLLSYSLYLWHWPVLALSRYRFGEHLNRAETVAALGVSFVLAWISWRFVERPLRCGTHTDARLRTLLGVCATAPALIVCASLVMHCDGFPARASADVLRYRSAQESKGFLHEVQTDQVRNRELPRFGAVQGNRKCLIWGDSHAMSLVPGLDAACRSRAVCGLQATHSSTPPLLDFVRPSQYGLDEKSPEFNHAVIELVRSEAVDVVVLSSAWSIDANFGTFEARLRKTVDALLEAGADVAIVLDVAAFDEDVPMALARRAFYRSSTEISVPREAYLRRNRKCNAIIESVANGKALIVDPARHLVDGDGAWPAELDGQVLYRDHGHLSLEGSRRLQPSFEEMLDSVAGK